MIRPALTRLASLFGVLLVVSMLVFFLGSLIPGDLASVIVGHEGATPEQFERVRRELGLDQPLIVQYLNWLGNAVTGDFGTSPITAREVSADIAQQFPVSLELALLCLVTSTVIGVPVGIKAAVSNKGWVDAAMRASLLVMFSVPVFVVGILLLLFASAFAPDLFNVTYVPWQQDLVGNLRSMALPVATIPLPFAAMTMQMTRSATLEVLSDPYITTARAVGVKRRRVHYVHALRNALPPVVTFLGFQFGVMMGGLLVVEQIFSLPGLGRGMLDAINNRDYPSVTAITMVFAAVFVVVNAAIDLLYPVLDPRQRSR